MSARDPFDGREMPANGKSHVCVYCVRGVRKLSPASWNEYTATCNPDYAITLSDTPFTASPHSQKRLTKSLERSAAWLADSLKAALTKFAASSDGLPPTGYPSLLVHMAGVSDPQARRAFAESLVEPLETVDRDRLEPLNTLDEGVAGYVFDLVPIRMALSARCPADVLADPSDLLVTNPEPAPTGAGDVRHSRDFVGLLQASLQPLPAEKPRTVNSTRSPHEMLQLILDVGIDLFDAHWAQRAADIGIALDFKFPVSDAPTDDNHNDASSAPRIRANGKQDIGHNLYNSSYAHDHSRLASAFLDAASAQATSIPPTDSSICKCAACSPRRPSAHISHSAVDAMPAQPSRSASDNILPPYTRSYIHHLLHTHEMSSHALLVMHNLAVLDAFFAGVRAVLARTDGQAELRHEAEKFMERYDETMVVFDEAKVEWREVELARGKGRLAREKAKQHESTIGTAVDLEQADS
ncbi:tRNA-guanine transglycosylase [Obba rivulosa]|uniref:tRNA-guanine transglycosylase n=1 Tax=Obba rivulosa TaxID=1052685 RepID=A0A8E2ATT1_9APHY|nr:tRNA-guanine transglycosylase [Obba rivulosa]